jgi:DNA-binding transcriptional MerR regulator
MPVRLPILAPPEPESADAESVVLASARAESRADARDGRSDAARPEEWMQVGDLARITGKTVRALHLYEELKLLVPAARSKGRYRLYGPEALVRIRWIGKLQDMGFSLTDIQTVVNDWEQQRSAPRAMTQMREVFRKKLDETREHLRRLVALERELEASLEYLDTCDVCDPDRLLSACQACDLHSCDDHVPELVAGFRANGARVSKTIESTAHAANATPSTPHTTDSAGGDATPGH